MLRVGKAIYSILSKDANVTSKVDTKIFPLIANAETTFPFITYKRSGSIPADTKDRFIYNYDMFVDIAVATSTYEEGIDIASMVEDALVGKRGIFEGIEIHDIKLVDSDEDYNEDTFIQYLKFNIKTNGRSN